MDLALILKATASLAVIGVVAVVLLATAAQRFTVAVDPKVQQIRDSLPGANCGACGNPSCFAAAEAMAEGRIPPNACVAGGRAVAESISAILGQACEFNPVVSVRRCGGGVHARRNYRYDGLRTCAAAAKLAGGITVCPVGCLGLGDCAVACPFDAIAIDERGLPVVDTARCTGCGICVRECPRSAAGLLALIPDTATVVVRCSSHETAKARRAACTMCCIGCRKCEKVCPSGAITVVDGLAVVDPSMCSGCLACVEACPQGCIDVTGRTAPLPARSLDGAGSSFPGFAAVNVEPESTPEAS